MKNFIIMTVILLAGFIGVNAQAPQTANEGYVGYSYLRQDVKFETPTLRFDENTDSHGVAVGYTRYLNGTADKAGTVGITGEIAANFDTNEASLVTAQGGLTLKARNFTRVQPSIRVLAGVARQKVNRNNITDTSDVAPAFTAGGGLDFPFSKSRYKLHLGADLVRTRFGGEYQNGARIGVGVIF